MVSHALKIAFLAVVFIFIHGVQGLAVMSIDLGSEWMKVAIVSPGVPMEIALNRESQRKTPVAVAFRDGERLFGDPAVSIGVRFPDKAYMYLLDVLGKKIDHPMVKLFLKRFPYYKVEANENRGTVIFKHVEGQAFAPEELLAMILKQAQEIAQNAAGQAIKDAVITVPPYFSQAERYAVLLAAQMSDLNVLQLINSNTATALNYGVFRRKDFNETPTNILFYDMGAGKTVATIASYQLVKSKETGEVSPQLTIKGVGFDRTLGGLEMQLRLRDHFAKAFSKEKKAPHVFENSRAMAKLLKEAGRVKKILSANTDHSAQVESLLEDIDFKCPISRTEFESLCSDLFKRVTDPVEVALASAGLSMDHIDQVILAGSGARVPKVQQILLEFVKKTELGKSINTDESAALGAAYQAAHLSKGFKVKTFIVRDVNVYPIQVNFIREYDSADKTRSVKNVRRTLFARNNLIPQKKAMTFNRMDTDFDFYINYGELNFLNEFELESLGSLNLTKVSVRGVQEALQKHSNENTEYKGVKAYFRIDEGSYFHFDLVEAIFENAAAVEEDKEKSIDIESTLSKLGSTIGRFFSSDDGTEGTEEQRSTDDPSTKADEKSLENETVAATEKEKTTNETKQSKPAKNETDTSKKEPKIVVVKEPLTSETVLMDLQQLSDIHIKEFVQRLEKLDTHDREKLAKDKAKNSLESFIVETKDKLYHNEYEQASTDDERTAIMDALSKAGEWLEYESDDATTEVFQKKLTELRKLTKELFDRVKEHQERPEAIKALKDMLNISEIFLMGALNMSEDEQIFTDVELTTLKKLITDTNKWVKESEAEQASLPAHTVPKLTIKLLSEKIASLDREVKYLLNKARFAKPLKKKVIPDSTTSKNDTDESAAAEGKEIKSETERDKKSEAEVTVEEPESETTTKPVTESPTPDKVKDDTHTEL